MFIKFFVILFFFIPFFLQDSFANSKKALNWQINNKIWTKSFDKSYEEFIALIGQAKKNGVCNTLNECLKNPTANPRFYNLNPEDLMEIYSDCADLPYILRAYFSWMNDLPFSYPTNLSPAAPKSQAGLAQLLELERLNSEYEKAGFIKKQFLKIQIKKLKKSLYGENETDIRYNKYGNKINEKRYIKNGENINQVLIDLSNGISTATFRTDASDNTTGTLFRDTYPAVISKASIKAGTILYDPNGHIAVVYEVTKNGKIHLIDAHPDNSLTSITYGEKFSQTNVEIGGGFSNWRPFRVDQGYVQASSNEELPDFSLEQFERKNPFIFNDAKMSFYEYVRNKLSVGNLVYFPLLEMKELMEEICHDVLERKSSVESAVTKGFVNQEHPSNLPSNIYGTDGDWEIFSTPSRDARLKASVREGRALVIKMLEGYKSGDQNIHYEGVDLVGDLRRTYEEASNACLVDVKKSNGEYISLNLDQVIENLFKLSFDPYHCIELRWGVLDAESLKSCNSSKVKLDWYNAEQGLRNFIDRDYSMKMDYSLKDLLVSPLMNIPKVNVSIKDVL